MAGLQARFPSAEAASSCPSAPPKPAGPAAPAVSHLTDVRSSCQVLLSAHGLSDGKLHHTFHQLRHVRRTTPRPAHDKGKEELVIMSMHGMDHNMMLREVPKHTPEFPM